RCSACRAATTTASGRTWRSAQSPARAVRSWSRVRHGLPPTRGRRRSRSSTTSATRLPIGTSLAWKRPCAQPGGRSRPDRVTRTCSTRSTTRSSSPISNKKTRGFDRGRLTMEGFVATKLDDFDRGKISRRRLIETLTLAATSVYAADAAKAQAPGLKVALVNHISYSCPNFRQAGDWYSKVFNLDQVGLKETEVTLPFGKMGEQPYNVAAKDVPLTFIISRAIDRPANPRNAGRPKPEAVIDHVAYTVADFNRERAKAELI